MAEILRLAPGLGGDLGDPIENFRGVEASSEVDLIAVEAERE